MRNASAHRKLRLAERMRKLKLTDEPADLTAVTFFLELVKEMMSDQDFISVYHVNDAIVNEYVKFFKSMLDGFVGPRPGFAYSIEAMLAFLKVFGTFLSDVNMLTE